MSGKTVSDLLSKAAQTLRKQGVEAGEAEARLLFLGASGWTATDIIARDNEIISPEVCQIFSDFMGRRMNREPVYRILGGREFHGLFLKLSPETLEPRDDTECLIDLVLETLRKRDELATSLLFADLGTGTGAIALSLLSELPNASALGTDIGAGALETAEKNAANNGLKARFETAQGSWADVLEGRFDFIVSNPPYIASQVVDGLEPEVQDHDPRVALDGGEDGLDAYRAILAGAHEHLEKKGFLALEIGFDQAESVSKLGSNLGWETVEVRKDYGNGDRALLLERQI